MLPPFPRIRRSPASLGPGLLILLFAGCGAEEPPHPWLDLTGAPPHEVVEVSGASQGQIVLLVPEGSAYEDVMVLAERIAEVAPPGATVNARIFDDEATAREWRTAPADWTLQHLLAVVTGVPETGLIEARWVGPAERGPPAPPTLADSVPSAPTDSLPLP